ncbi:hypothetical protein NPS01_39080 [Nocardioides psychrotolerans]|uniref:Uncharacterized protein n=1 Tax=Nocardioides psychrotolerans TaxID=1005945 RepID=A0A1I3CHG2_9ACTN|nr:hypothetical protein [Nocardioides psychrotolerans]GEP40245.1 hypothetical protein NPS01_39080 [Nocardioides psychrotolerans]SFH73927.1 hypothetical protein SAMN05216561_10266 [Nocardioides psychrotolerans]
MSSEQRRPLMAFCAVALVCAVIMASALRSDAVRGFLTTGIEAVQEVAAGVEIAPRPPVKAAPVAPEPALTPAVAVVEVTRPVVSTPTRSTTRPDRGQGAKPGRRNGSRGHGSTHGDGDKGGKAHGSKHGDRDKGGKGHGSKHGDRDKGGKGHGSKHGDRDKGDRDKAGKGHGSKHGDRDKGGKGHRGHR